MGELEQIGRYKILARLAEGGMAEIFLARQTGIGGFEKLVVVKRILPHLAREKTFVEMFLDEAIIAAQLNHPNIVQIYDLGQADENYFIAMEYLEGETLGHLARQGVEAGRPLPYHLIAGIVAQVCDGLAYAHAFEDDSGNPLNLVHRDISPHNIIVLFSGVVKVVDFGIAKAATKSHQTRVGTLKGKLAYMPPEQCMGQHVDGRSDIFSLGVVLWELLTRRRLFKREVEPAMIRAIVDEPIPKVLDARADVPPALAAIADQALRKDQEKRFQNASAFAKALRSAIHQLGEEANRQAVSTYIQDVFGDRARTKKKLLEEIRAKGAEGVAIKALAPKSDSFPSQSLAGQVQDQGLNALAEAATRIRDTSEDSDVRDKMPTPPVEKPDKGPSSKVEVQEDIPPEFEPEFQHEDQPELTPLPPLKSKSRLPLIIVAAVMVIGLGVGGYFYWQSTQTGPDITKPQPLRPPDGIDPKPADPKPGDLVATGPKPDDPQLVDAGTADPKPDDPKPDDPKPDDPKPDDPKPDDPKPDDPKPDDPKPDDPKPDDPKPDDPKPADVIAKVENPPSDPKPPKDPPPKKPDPMLLSVQSQPAGCAVAVDGKLVKGKTPLSGLELPAGRHQVAVACKGHKREVKKTSAKPGQKVSLAFAPTVKGKRPIKPVVSKKPGRLTLSTKPWTEIYLGKKKLGMTPLLNIELKPGSHKLTAVNEARGIRKTITVVIKPGELTTKRLKIK